MLAILQSWELVQHPLDLERLPGLNYGGPSSHSGSHMPGRVLGEDPAFLPLEPDAPFAIREPHEFPHARPPEPAVRRFAPPILQASLEVLRKGLVSWRSGRSALA